MKHSIHRITLGVTNYYLIGEESLIMVDSGSPDNLNKFSKMMSRLSLKPENISLLFLTHGHFDHIGSASEIKKLVGCKIAIPHLPYPQTQVDMPLNDKEYSLKPFGINGRILSTPGHSLGSMSLLLDSGEAFVGDLSMSGFPLRWGPGLPVYAENLEQVKESWNLLVDNGAKSIYPAHWNPFKAEVLRKLQ